MDEMELRASLILLMDQNRVQALWNSGAAIDARVRGWSEFKERRIAILDGLTQVVRARVAATKALRTAIIAMLSPEQESQFERASRDCALLGIERERPRFERPLRAAMSLVAAEPERVPQLTKAYTQWEEMWETLSARIASFDNGAAYRATMRQSWLSGRARHDAAVVRWLEVRRREESLVALRRAASRCAIAHGRRSYACARTNTAPHWLAAMTRSDLEQL